MKRFHFPFFFSVTWTNIDVEFFPRPYSEACILEVEPVLQAQGL